MNSSTSNFASYSLKAAVTAFEDVLKLGHVTDLAAFLPEKDHPRYNDILLELIRMDLEFGWTRGNPRNLEQYEDRFPEFFRQSQNLQAVAFEEYRQRWQAGDSVSPSEYEKRYDVDTSHWPLAFANVDVQLPACADQESADGQEHASRSIAHKGSWEALSMTRQIQIQTFDDWQRLSPELAEREAE